MAGKTSRLQVPVLVYIEPAALVCSPMMAPQRSVCGWASAEASALLPCHVCHCELMAQREGFKPPKSACQCSLSRPFSSMAGVADSYDDMPLRDSPHEASCALGVANLHRLLHGTIPPYAMWRQVYLTARFESIYILTQDITVVKQKYSEVR